MTPEENIAEFLRNLSFALEHRRLAGRDITEILIAATPVATAHYLKGQ